MASNNILERAQEAYRRNNQYGNHKYQDKIDWSTIKLRHDFTGYTISLLLNIGRWCCTIFHFEISNVRQPIANLTEARTRMAQKILTELEIIENAVSRLEKIVYLVSDDFELGFVMIPTSEIGGFQMWIQVAEHYSHRPDICRKYGNLLATTSYGSRMTETLCDYVQKLEKNYQEVLNSQK